jgi:CMP-N,N'-diacetyllegionaminic acid synthase
MINGKTILGIIPARGGSKGIPRKNLIIFGGKPLMAWTIEAGLQSHYIDRLILSSEDEEIIAVAREWGCEVPFIRPAELSRDDTPGIEPVIHAIKTLKTSYDYIILLQPTSPLRSAVPTEKI